VEPPGVNNLEAGPRSPELPVGNNGWGNIDTQLLFVSKNAIGIIGSEDGRGDASQPGDKMIVILTGLLAGEESARGKLAGEDVDDQVTDVGDVASRVLEETLLGLFGDLVLVNLEETAVGGNLFVVERLELGSLGGSGDTLESGLT
jgi:hypothetical protein